MNGYQLARGCASAFGLAVLQYLAALTHLSDPTFDVLLLVIRISS
jgi:hypothetical protein